MLRIPHVTRANYLKYGFKLMEITSKFEATRAGESLIVAVAFGELPVLSLSVLLDERKQNEARESEIFEDISQIQPSDQDGPASTSAYFANNNSRSSGYKRKRGGAKGGGKKLSKNGQWFTKRNSTGAKASTSSRRKTASPRKTASSGGASKTAGGMLPPPRFQSVKSSRFS